MPLISTPGRLARQAEFYHQLGVMLGSGVPLIQALQMAGKHTTVRLRRDVIRNIGLNLESGLTFADSLKAAVGWLPEFDIALLSVAETSGTLDTAFKQLAAYYTIRARIIRETISGLIITVISLHMFLMIFPLSYFIAFVQGIVENDFAKCLPFIIEKVIVFGVLYGGVFLVIYACQSHRGEVWRAVVENVLNFVPFLRNARKYLALSRLAAALAAVVNSGMSIIQGWDLAGATCGSPRIRSEIRSWRGNLAHGDTPAEMVAQSHLFPETFANLYATGEKSGQLDEMLRRLHTYYQEEGFRTLRIFTRVMNGVLYAIVAVVIAYNVIRFWVDYYGGIMNQF